MFKNGQRLGVEFKRNDAPKLSASMKTVFETLQLDSLSVIYPGEIRYSLAKNIQVIPLNQYILQNSQ